MKMMQILFRQALSGGIYGRLSFRFPYNTHPIIKSKWLSQDLLID